MPIYRGVEGVTRQVTRIFRGVGGTNREIMQEWKTVNGIARRVFDNSGGSNYKSWLSKYNGETSGYTNYQPNVGASGDFQINTWSSASEANPQTSALVTNGAIYLSRSVKVRIAVVFRNGFHITKNTKLQIVIQHYGNSGYPSETGSDVLLTINAGNHPMGSVVVLEAPVPTYTIGNNYRFFIRVLDKGGQTSTIVEVNDFMLVPN